MTTVVATIDRPVVRQRSRAFTWLWLAFGSGSLADGIYQVALPIAALRAGGGAGTVALVMMASRAPWLLVSLHAGVLVDRVDRRTLLLAVSGGRFALLASTAGLITAGWGGAPLLVAVAFLMGAGETVFDTALHSTTPRVIAPEDLEKANGRLQATETIAAQFFGPSVGGVIVGIAVGAAFGATGVLFLAALLALRGLRVPAVARPERAERVGAAAWTGLKALCKNRTLLTYSLGGCAVNCGFAAYYAALPVVALGAGPLHVTAGGYGLMLAAAGIGGLATSLSAPSLIRRAGARGSIAVAAVLLAAGLAVPGLLPKTPIVVIGLMATGAVVLISVVTVSYRQRAVPDHMLGRVTAAYRMFTFGGLPLGSALAGVVGTVAGSSLVFPIAGALVIVAGVAMTLVSPKLEEQLA
jgi:MFS family permease